MKRLLYITPYFPPQQRIGALRAHRFARRLPRYGWEATVLADLRSADPVHPYGGTDETSGYELYRQYSRAAGRTEIAWRTGQSPRPGARRLRSMADRFRPELLPLGEHTLRLPHAYRRARHLVRQKRFDAVLVNADPYAALLLGARLARSHGLPFVADLRDPWALCDLRRPLRPPWARVLVDRVERHVVESARRVVLNTRACLQVYRDYYVDIEPSRFDHVPNAADPDAWAACVEPDRTTGSHVLFLGNLRRFVEGHVLVDALVRLRSTQPAPTVVVAGAIPDQTLRYAEESGVATLLRAVPYGDYSRVGALMDSATALLLLTHDSQLRIPAKFYDYCASRRPIVAATDNHELRRQLDEVPGARYVSAGDAAALAAALDRAVRAGRDTAFVRESTMRVESGVARMAQVLDAAVG